MNKFKNLVIILLFSFGWILYSFKFQPREPFEGKIIYQIHYEEVGADMEAYTHMLPQESVLYIKGQKSRFEQSTSPEVKQVFIGNSLTQEFILMLNFMEEKFFVRLDSTSILQDNENENSEFISLNESTEILGYECNKFQNITTEGDTLLIHVTNKLPSSFAMQKFNVLDGLPLEYETVSGPMKLRLKAKSIEPGSVPDSLFSPPPGMKEITPQEFLSAFKR